MLKRFRKKKEDDKDDLRPYDSFNPRYRGEDPYERKYDNDDRGRVRDTYDDYDRGRRRRDDDYDDDYDRDRRGRDEYEDRGRRPRRRDDFDDYQDERRRDDYDDGYDDRKPPPRVSFSPSGSPIQRCVERKRRQ